MTMADTVAVMHQGRIEQMGAPAALYENPSTTFVANFLGQSNLVEGEICATHGGVLEVAVHGGVLRAPQERAHIAAGRVWVGVRPEKIYLAPAGEEIASDHNTLSGGSVTDVSFVGVSTQYLVRMPWGQELMAFEQNTGARPTLRTGDRVDVHWNPTFTFLLDAAQDAEAGVERGDTP